MKQAAYNTVQVPRSADGLKEYGVRVFMVGVPRADGDSPNVDYFAGIPDPALNPPSAGARKQCWTRSGKKTCGFLDIPPFPIVSEPVDKNLFSSTTWDVDALIEQTLGSLCEVLDTPRPTVRPVEPTRSPTTLTPTQSPTKFPTTAEPTARPTNFPTDRPTGAPVIPILDHVDAYIILDRSKSMRDYNKLCEKLVDLNLPPASSGAEVACWELFIGFVKNLVQNIANIPVPTNQRTVGWYRSYGGGIHNKGLRVSVFEFWCENSQTQPQMKRLIDYATSYEQLLPVLEDARINDIPDGGTCPHQVIEAVVRSIMRDSNREVRPFKTAIMISDGITYDGNLLAKAAKGLHHYNVATFAIGIAIPTRFDKHGLSDGERKKQKKQLRSFAGTRRRVFSLNQKGFELLPTIAQQLADDMPSEVVQSPQTEPFCGWIWESTCKNFDDVCKLQFGKCRPINWCNYRRAMPCRKDKNCAWGWRNGTPGRCAPKNP